MGENVASVWTVAKINYAEPHERLLIKSVKPLVDVLFQAGIVERYSFRRCTEGGGYIRLAFRCNAELLDTLVKPNITDHFEAYFKQKPSVGGNDSVEFCEYEPEKCLWVSDGDWWGGDVGRPIAERFAEASSYAVLEALAEKYPDGSPERRLEIAIALQLGFVNALELDADGAIKFFEFCISQSISKEFSIQYAEQVFLKKKQTYINFNTKIWQKLVSGDDFDEPYYNRWITNCYYAIQDFKRTFKQRSLTIEPQFSSLWRLLACLTRSTNNRLNIKNEDETLLYYVIIRALEAQRQAI